MESDGQVMDPVDIDNSDQLATALSELRGTRSLRELGRVAKQLPTRGGRAQALPTSTVGDVLNGKSLPSVDTLVTLLLVCGLDNEEAQKPWLEARERVETRHQRRPSGAVRVRDARPRLLGVHAAIQIAGTSPSSHVILSREDELPLYVPRDLDLDLRAKLNKAVQQGGFVLLVGSSSVGKTRALFEAVQAVLPTWWLIHPADPDGVRQCAVTPPVHTVVWLDELQNYLDHPSGLSVSTFRDLLNAGVVVVATLWPSEYAFRIAPRVPERPDPHAEDRQLLGLADVVAVPDTFTPAERHRAQDLAATDRRVRIALDTPDAGFTQVMTAGPELVRWWEHAPDKHCYGKAVITAALDARRVGAQAPLTRNYLEDAAPGYLTNRQQAAAPPDWLDRALQYATTPLHGAAAALCPVAAGMGRIAGYYVADYLHQHALRVRRTKRLPDTAWRALTQHHHPEDRNRLAENAELRGRPDEAITIYRLNVDAGDLTAIYRLADRLARQSKLDEATALLKPYAASDWLIAEQLIRLLIRQGRIDEAFTWLWARADVGAPNAIFHLVDLLVEWGRRDEAIALLQCRDTAKDPNLAYKLAWLIAADPERIDEAITLLHPHASSDSRVASQLARLLIYQDRSFDEVIAPLRAHVAAGDSRAISELIELSVGASRVDEVIALLQHRIDAGDPGVAAQLTRYLTRQGRNDEAVALLQRHVDAGDPEAAVELAEHLIRQGRHDEAITVLQPHVVACHVLASLRLTRLLADLGQIDDLEAEVLAGTWGAADALRSLRS